MRFLGLWKRKTYCLTLCNFSGLHFMRAVRAIRRYKLAIVYQGGYV